MNDQNTTEDEGLLQGSITRRTALRVGAVGATGLAVTAARGIAAPYLEQRGLLSADGVFAAASTAVGDQFFYVEAYPTSPLILSPFNDPLVVPKALAPTGVDVFTKWDSVPGPEDGKQNSLKNEKHQRWSNHPDIKYPNPLVYKIDVEVAQHRWTTSKVRPIDSKGKPTGSFDEKGNPRSVGDQVLPLSTIYGFNGTFPGPMINAEYGQPCLVRFTNKLDQNPNHYDRQDFGAPDWSFLTHLHNGHTAPESDGNPHYTHRGTPNPDGTDNKNSGPRDNGYLPTLWVDNLYLNWPAGGDDREKQSFFWFHDHRMDHTGSNVYKGMDGLSPIYDPKNSLDMGDETKGLRLPGVRKDRSDGAFDVEYDIPLAFYDLALDDGKTVHHDYHDNEFPEANNPRTHPEWWGKSFFRHYPNHGFVGDIMTVNGTAYPVMKVKRRKYRFRFLDASISRIYEFALMRSSKGPQSAASLGYGGEELQGQWRIEDGQQCMQFTQIASDGGLLPFAIKRNSFELWPAKRREVIIDFTQYQDGTPTHKDEEIFLTNIMKMGDGRMWDASSRFSGDPRYKIPMIKFVIESDTLATDDSVMPDPGKKLRDLPPLPSNWKDLMGNRSIFEVERGSAGGEIEWLINGVEFDATTELQSMKNPAGKFPFAKQKMGSFNLWEIRNGGGGWVHPFHLHMEEHRTVMRNGKDVSKIPDRGHPDDISREDLVALDPSESTVIYRGFRDFVGHYVAHCHNLAHEDHAMMFGWSITP